MVGLLFHGSFNDLSAMDSINNNDSTQIILV